MTIESGLIDWLNTNVPSLKFHPGWLPQGVALPANTFFLISSVPTHALDQFGKVERARFRFAFFSDNYGDTVENAQTLRLALEGYRGSFGTYAVHGVFGEDVGDEYEPAGNASDRGTYQRHVDYVVVYSQY